MIKQSWILLFGLFLLFGMSLPANATLWDRGGGLIYDDVLNITWLQDANYANTQGYDDDGKMTWISAFSWAQDLEYHDALRNTTWSDWRLPQTLPINGVYYNDNRKYDGSTDDGYNISRLGSAYPESINSEMAYTYYNNLGNLGLYDLNGNHPQSGWDSAPNAIFIDGYGKIVSFLNLQSDYYWSNTQHIPFVDSAWGFYFYDGHQRDYSIFSNFYAWAVRDGDVGLPVPEPTTILLLFSGLVGLAGFRRRFFKK